MHVKQLDNVGTKLFAEAFFVFNLFVTCSRTQENEDEICSGKERHFSKLCTYEY